MTRGKILMLLGSVCLALMLAVPLVAACAAPAEGPTPIKVGVTGPLSGEKASWGLTFKRCTEMWADEINAEGGLLVDGVRHPIEVYVEDTRYDAALAKTAAERLAYEHKVRYVMGPATTMELKVMQPILEPEKIVDFAGSFTNSLYGPEHPYTIMVVPPAFAFAPIVFDYLIETENAKTLYCLGTHDPTGHVCCVQAAEAGKNAGLEVLEEEATFEMDIIDFYPVITKVIAANPDILAIGCGAEHQSLIAKACGELGFKGRIVAVLAGDIETMVSVAGKYAEGVIWMGGQPNPNPLTDKFMDDYEARYGVWNDEALLKIVAAWMIGATIQEAGKAALTDNDAWVEAMPRVAWPHRYVEGNPVVRYASGWILGKDCMIGLPIGITEVQNGKAVMIKWVMPK